MKLPYIFLATLIALSVAVAYCQELDKTTTEKELENVDFKDLADILKKDKLDKHLEEKVKKVETIQKKRKEEIEKKKVYPGANDFWKVITQMWIAKNAPVLKWDFEKAELGIGQSFQNIMKKVGLIKRKVHILIVNTDQVFHFALPGYASEAVLLLSFPFIKALDLSKVEISLVLLESFVRHELDFFRKNLKERDWEEKLGQKITTEEVDMSFVNKLLKSYTSVVFEDGFSFNQQFEVTKKMTLLLNSHPELKQAYFNLLKKLKEQQEFIPMLKGYNKIYPTPEMQIEWIQPSQKKKFP